MFQVLDVLWTMHFWRSYLNASHWKKVQFVSEVPNIIFFHVFFTVQSDKLRHILSVAVVEKILSIVSGDLELYGFMNYHHLNNKQQNWWKMSIITIKKLHRFFCVCVHQSPEKMQSGGLCILHPMEGFLSDQPFYLHLGSWTLQYKSY